MAISSEKLQTRQERRRVRALADPTRIVLFELLTERPRPVSELAEYVGVPPDRLYHHLDVLEESGWVRLRQFRPSRVYEAVLPTEVDPEEVSEDDRLHIIDAVFDLVRANAESAHRRSDPHLKVEVQSLRLTARQLESLTAEVKAIIERWSQVPPSRGARGARVLFSAVPLAPGADEAWADKPDVKTR